MGFALSLRGELHKHFIRNFLNQDASGRTYKILSFYATCQPGMSATQVMLCDDKRSCCLLTTMGEPNEDCNQLIIMSAYQVVSGPSVQQSKYR